MLLDFLSDQKTSYLVMIPIGIIVGYVVNYIISFATKKETEVNCQDDIKVIFVSLVISIMFVNINNVKLPIKDLFLPKRAPF
jgi:hypothetical protein